MKVLMLGWEFPPFFAGGLGIVCYEMTKVFEKKPEIDEVIYLMPYGPKDYDSHVSLLGANQLVKKYAEDLTAEQQAVLEKVHFEFIPSLLHSPYSSPEEYKQKYKKLSQKLDFKKMQWKDIDAFLENLPEGVDYTNQKNAKNILYGRNIFEEVYRFAKRVALVVETLDFDIIHAHDWMTMPAAIAAKRMSGKPLVVHIHNTIYDRYLGNGGYDEKELEIQGLIEADKVIAISNLIKNTLVTKYGVPEQKIEVIHNGATEMDEKRYESVKYFKGKKIVLFAGRITIQKGGEYFVRAAAKVVEHMKDVVFVVAGTGDELGKIIELAAQMNVLEYFYFHGFYTLQERDMFFGMADIFVMPSVSEPFGIVPLEAMSKRTPAIISYQSGVSEILTNTFKVDFWDIDRLANQMICLLTYPELHDQMKESGYEEIKNYDWNEPVDKIIEVYKKLHSGGGA